MKLSRQSLCVLIISGFFGMLFYMLSSAMTVNIQAVDRTEFPSQGSCTKEIDHLGFVKVHKAGSTTTMNILQRFAYVRDLFIALPKEANIISREFDNLVEIPVGQKYDMLINHVEFYNRSQFESVLYNDTKYIGIVREPLEVTKSGFRYYLKLAGMYRNIPGENKLLTYLSNREKYEPRSTYTNNRMSYDFGLDSKYFHNSSKIKEFLKNLDKEMDLVMVLERYIESLVLLKRMLCWQTKDILFITRNKNEDSLNIAFTPEELIYHRNYSLADNMLYDYFVERFDSRVKALRNTNFQREVEDLEFLLPKVNNFCLNTDQPPDKTFLKIPKNEFHGEFQVTIEDCKLMTYHELRFCDVYRRKQRQLLSRYLEGKS